MMTLSLFVVKWTKTKKYNKFFMESIFKYLHICFMKSKSSNSDSVPSIDTGGTDRSFVSRIKSIYAYYIHGIYAIHSLKLSCMHISGCQLSLPKRPQFSDFEVASRRNICVFWASFKYTFSPLCRFYADIF